MDQQSLFSSAGFYTLRPYQDDAVNAAVDFFQSNAKHNALMVLPTGSGKSLIIAATISRLEKPTLIFQPTKEILEQNYSKMCSYGYAPGIYSASKGKKEIRPITFATIGSVKNNPEIFKEFRHIIIDETHLVNPKAGMYCEFLKQFDGVKVLGLTATPYRLNTDGYGGSMLKFLTRTRPKVFRDLIYFVQNKKLFDEGYLAPIRYSSSNGFDRSQLALNTTGADFTDRSVKRYYASSGFPDRVAMVTSEELKFRKNALVFTRFIKEAQKVVDQVHGAEIITGKTKKREREILLRAFKNNEIRAIVNCGVLTTGFDYPELETIILARPTMSLALYYQMIGRGIRTYPGKIFAKVIDMCGNLDLFGRVEDLKIIDGGNGKWFIAGENGRQLTNIYYGEKPKYRKH